MAPDEPSAIAQDFGANDWLIDEMYEQYQSDPDSLDPAWRTYFEHAEPTSNGTAAHAGPTVRASLTPSSPAAEGAPSEPPASSAPANGAAASAPQAAPAPVSAASAAEKKKVAAAAEDLGTPQPSKASAAVAATATVRATVEPAVTKAAGTPSAPAAGLTANAPNPSKRPAPTSNEPNRTPLRGAALRTAKNMDSSLTVPTATSVRTVPMKLVMDLRTMINNHLRQTTGGKVSYTHLIGYAMVQALKAVPAMTVAYELVDGKANIVEPQTINLGLAIDVVKADGTRQLLVPNIRGCEDLNFAQFMAAYDDLVKRSRSNTLTVDDYAGTTASLTNPGGIGTTHSVPRLMGGQGVILGVGSIEYAPGFQGASPARLNELGISRVMTLTSTYDHRVIQGAQSGEFLRTMEQLLLGQHGFYEDVFASLRIPYAPLKWDTDVYAYRPDQVVKEARVLDFVTSYRTLGHLLADIDPLQYRLRSHPDLELESHGLTLWDLDREFAIGRFGGKEGQHLPLRQILERLRDAYCRHIGVEYMFIQDTEERHWLQDRLESQQAPIDHEEHIRILDRLNESEIFETFLQTKFVGQKRFSLEGGESTIVALDEICELAADSGLEEVCIGMPHRGRLNVLANIVGKSYGQIFREFEGRIDPGSTQGSGDVKYHLGAEGEFTAASGRTVRASVAANPSHLEAVDPVVIGIARAKQDRSTSDLQHPILPILLHGDAAFSAQGVVYETLQMSQLRGYTVGGSIHIVVNNQVGFTTAPVESRSSAYCTDVAKAVQAPIFHVNGDDPDACVRVARLAFEFRQRFAKDVVIDLVCYRRRGHNEGDDPSFTQPLMYDLIEQKRSTRKLYTESLIGRGDISVEDADDVASRFRDRLETVFKEVRDAKSAAAGEEYSRSPYYPKKLGQDAGTSVTAEVLSTIAEAHVAFPENFLVHPKVSPQLSRRREAILNGPIDWATGEILALGSLLMEGRPVRLTGQDTRRGTFSQRFAAIVDRHTNEAWVPLKHLSGNQGAFDVYDSLLSEYAAMGFEYGYSVAAPEALVLWEAQFGDFANGAQTIADEFISSGNAKWTQKSGVVLLLPHGYEGQGPDHSSARIERWLQLCSEGALAVCQPSTPASHFHLLRTHAYVNWHRPLIIATPKSMLRSKAAVSQPEDFMTGHWQPAMGDPTITDPSAVKRIILCSGKIRWDLVAQRTKLGLDGEVAIITLERLYPLPAVELAAELDRYRHVTDIRYVQDEPANQGAWWFMDLYLADAIRTQLPGYELKMTGITRPHASAPSVGSHKVHEEQEKELLLAALTETD